MWCAAPDTAPLRSLQAVIGDWVKSSAALVVSRNPLTSPSLV